MSRPGHFGREARSARARAKISLTTLAATFGVHPAYVSDVELGRRNPPSPRRIAQWARVIGADENLLHAAAALDRTGELRLDASGLTLDELRRAIDDFDSRCWVITGQTKHARRPVV